MDKKSRKDNKRAESSLLLTPSSVPTWSVSGNSMLMPVVVGPAEHSHGSTEQGKQSPHEGLPTKGQKTDGDPFLPAAQHHHGFVSQLQQPLMVTKSQALDDSAPPVSQSSTLPSSVSQPCAQPLNMEISSSVSAAQHFGIGSLGPSTQTQSALTSHGLSPEPVSYAEHEKPSQSCDFGELNNAASELHSREEANVVTNANDDELLILFHWFFQEIIEGKELWYAFSASDSLRVEKEFQKELEHPTSGEVIIPVIGGRYDVYLKQRKKRAVYWEEEMREVRRCSWFNKEEGSQYYVPYDEQTACILEEHYQRSSSLDKWQQRVLVNDEVVLFDGPKTIIHYKHGQSSWPPTDPKLCPVMVYRGVPADVTFLPEEEREVDHLVFIVQGVGSVCDLRFRSVAQCVDGFREMANRLIPVHFKNESEAAKIHRVEFLPLAWHSSLHEKDIGFDRRMKAITLPSIPKLRHFTNDTLLDILLYSSPVYCQAIINTVANDMNTLYDLFCSRNPTFHGKVSVAGHSLGSLILFDLLSNQFERVDIYSKDTSETMSQVVENELKHQKPELSTKDITFLFNNLDLQEYLEPFLAEKMDIESLKFCDENELKSLGLPMGPRKKLLAYLRQPTFSTDTSGHASVTQPNDDFVSCVQENTAVLESRMPQHCSEESVYPGNSVYTTLSSVTFPNLKFHPACFFALGSPIAMFLAVRGFTTIRKDFCFPTCPSFFHIFHPYDPVAFRIEPLIDPNFTEAPVVIPHHKGRKRMHIEIRENITKVGSELRQKVLETLKYTWGHLNLFSKGSHFSDAVEAEVEKIVQEEMNSRNQESSHVASENVTEQIYIGCLNGGRRIDYVLQEKPIEALNEYIFALTSHATYWTSEDTALMILKEVYSSQGISSNRCSSEMDESSSSYKLTEPPCSNIPIPLKAPEKNIQSLGYTFVSQVPPQDMTLPASVVPAHCHDQIASDVPISADVSVSSHQSSNGAPRVDQPLAPPPLSGFVKKSAFFKR